GVILSGGGHAMAGGLSLDPAQIEPFATWLNGQLKQESQALAAARELSIDAVTVPGAITADLVDSIAQIGPFGAGAPEPVFALKDVEVVHARPIGDSHLKVTVEDMTGRIDCLAWRVRETPMGDSFLRGGRKHLSGRLKINEWNGRRRAEFELIDAAEV
ncbi:MAG: single-stranded-DNA-specific exonuclease RecJ, partial [Pseudomonadota bacterium]